MPGRWCRGFGGGSGQRCRSIGAVVIPAGGVGVVFLPCRLVIIIAKGRIAVVIWKFVGCLYECRLSWGRLYDYVFLPGNEQRWNTLCFGSISYLPISQPYLHPPLPR